MVTVTGLLGRGSSSRPSLPRFNSAAHIFTMLYKDFYLFFNFIFYLPTTSKTFLKNNIILFIRYITKFFFFFFVYFVYFFFCLDFSVVFFLEVFFLTFFGGGEWGCGVGGGGYSKRSYIDTFVSPL